MKKLAIISTHPTQYYAPIFQLLNARNQIEVKVFYTWGVDSNKKHDPGFGKLIEWDLPLIEGYGYEWAVNTSKRPGSHHFRGIKTPHLTDRINAWRPDALLVFGWAYQSHLMLIRHFHQTVPVYFRGDSTILGLKPSLKSFLKSCFLKWVYSHVDRAFYVGSANKEYFEQYGFKQEQLVFAPHAIDNERFSKDRSVEVLALRKTLGINNNHLVVLFAGKFSKNKGPEILLKAFLNLAKSDTHLLFTGNGEMETHLKAEVQRRQSPNIHFIDFQNQSRMPVIYQASDLFCFPSTGPETWGLAVNEAMACGKAVLVANTAGCARDLVSAGVNGLTFRSGDLLDLQQKLDYLTSSQVNLVEFGKQSKKMIQNLNFNIIADAIELEINKKI